MLVINNNSHRFHLSLLSIYNQQQLNNDDNATTQQQLDYAICMWYQSTC